jgi:tetratricopeptide (TPR) repeat protein
MFPLALLCVLLALASGDPTAAGQQKPSTPPPAPSAGLETYAKRGDAARAAGRLDEAAAIYGEAVRSHPRWTEGHWYLGTISYELGHFGVCRSELQQVVKVQTQNGAAWGFKGLCEFQLKSYPAALADLVRAKRLGVGDDADFNAVVGYHRAILLTQDGQFERALEEYSNFVRGGNTTATIAEGLGTALLRIPSLPSALSASDRDMVRLAGQAAIYGMGRMKDEAERAFTQLVTTYGDKPNVHYVHGLYMIHDRPDQGLAEFKLELKQSPNHVAARVQIAQELLRRGDLEGATPFAKEAAQLAPRNFVARRVLGQVKLQSGDVPGAIVDLETAVKLEPASPSAHFHLARAYQRASRAADAKRERETFSKLEKLQQVQRGGANAVGADEDPQN